MAELKDPSTDPVIIMLLANGGNINPNDHGRETLFPLIQSIRGAHSKALVHVLGITPCGPRAFVLDRYQDVIPLPWSPSSKNFHYDASTLAIDEALQILEAYASQVSNATRHIVMVVRDIQDDIHVLSPPMHLGQQLQKTGTVFHALNTPECTGLLETIIGEVFHDMHVVIPPNDKNDFTYRSTRLLLLPAIGSIDLGPETFSLDSFFLDSEDFQSSSSASILKESEHDYDWDLVSDLIKRHI